jgi:hypothetical protein
VKHAPTKPLCTPAEIEAKKNAALARWAAKRALESAQEQSIPISMPAHSTRIDHYQPLSAINAASMQAMFPTMFTPT